MLAKQIVAVKERIYTLIVRVIGLQPLRSSIPLKSLLRPTAVSKRTRTDVERKVVIRIELHGTLRLLKRSLRLAGDVVGEGRKCADHPVLRL
jgi:hypothetical protein